MLSKVEKAPQMVLGEDRLSVTSHKGYRMVSSASQRSIAQERHGSARRRRCATAHACLALTDAQPDLLTS